MRLDFLIVGTNANRRVELFQKALVDSGLNCAQVVLYSDILEKRTTLAQHLRPGTIVRIESPERDFEVYRMLLELGAADAEEEGSPVLLAQRELQFDRGLILHPRQWYLGFRKLLRSLAKELSVVPGARAMNAPEDIETMFDKPSCHERCREAGIPVPEALGAIRSFEELLEAMSRRKFDRVFIKLANGSSASGVVALSRSFDSAAAATTIEMVRDHNTLRLYNSRRLRTYTDEREIAALIDTLCRERVHVERWLPKATFDEHGNFDLRVLVIAGSARHVVVRQSRGPITNLHLLNQRGDLDRLKSQMGEKNWTAALATCDQAMRIVPRSLYAGIDLLIMPGLRRHALLEINAFGDLLPGVILNGNNTYESEVSRLMQRIL